MDFHDALLIFSPVLSPVGLFALRCQLSASPVDILSSGGPDRGRDPMLVEHIPEHRHPLLRTGLQVYSFNSVEAQQIHPRRYVPDKLDELSRMIHIVVHPAPHDVFKR